VELRDIGQRLMDFGSTIITKEASGSARSIP